MDKQDAIRRVRKYLFAQDWKVQRSHQRGCDVMARRKGRLLLVEVQTIPDSRKRVRLMNALDILALVNTDSIMWRLYGETDFADSIMGALNVRKRQ